MAAIVTKPFSIFPSVCPPENFPNLFKHLRVKTKQTLAEQTMLALGLTSKYSTKLMKTCFGVKTNTFSVSPSVTIEKKNA
jgi:hypothetical protein